MRLWKVQAWVATFAIAAALMAGTLGSVYLMMNNFKAASDKAKMEASINKLIEKQNGIDDLLNRLVAGYEHQQAAIEDLSNKTSDPRSTTWIKQTLIGFCLNPSNRREGDYCSQIDARVRE
jgi:hypothetical protein